MDKQTLLINLAMGTAILIVALAVRAIAARLRSRINFSLLTLPTLIIGAILLLLPTPLYLFYEGPCQDLDDLPLAWIFPGVILIAALPLAAFNIRHTNMAYACAATVLQLAGLAFVFALGLLPPTVLTGLGNMGHGGMRVPCP
ncbi:hypothetical protein [Rugamonas sp. DEMB1]|uniref:hypothetical protein n=1 Tax=Rugamonas sp. DEMB1 TaxID=3039386 RepID=UPI0024479054|nr:hypothetical protein [Rugamonas sp. DEMB1]WGG48552.1 hypothetical protein QC826_17915 [Rugamonas sp. DEMB1]